MRSRFCLAAVMIAGCAAAARASDFDITAGGHHANQAPFHVGQSTVFGNRHVVGSIGGVAVYTTAWSKADAKALWKSAAGK